MELNKIILGDCLDGLKGLPYNSVDCCVTSPPYFGLRDYGHADQLGLEETPDEYVSNMVKVFGEVKRVLKKEGTLWLNIGDSYYGSGKGGGGLNNNDKGTKISSLNQNRKAVQGLKAKDLIGIPWMLAFALRADGWYLRQDIIWAKPNPMPESVTDRCTKSHEYIFMLSKSAKYFYDAESIKTAMTGSDHDKRMRVSIKRFPTDMINGIRCANDVIREMANKRSVWTVNPRPYSEAHFATFPERLIVDCIKAGCPENGLVLDHFMGSGTTALVARKLNRNFIGFELNPEYIEIAEKRLKKELGMFL